MLDITGPDAETLIRIARIYIADEDYRRALEYFHRLLQLDPENDGLWYNIGTLHSQLEEPDSSEHYLRRALEMDAAPTYYLSLSYFLYDHQRGDEAVQLLREGIEKLPDAARLYNQLGFYLQRRGEYVEALEALFQSTRVDTTSASPFITIGLIYNELDSLDLSIAAYENALKIDPENALAMNNYAYLLAEAGIRLEEAYDISAKSLEKEPKNPSFLDTMGWILYRMSEYERAEQYIRQALELNNNWEILFHLGEILMKMDRVEEAMQAYRDGLKIDPDNRELKRKLELD